MIPRLPVDVSKTVDENPSKGDGEGAGKAPRTVKRELVSSRTAIKRLKTNLSRPKADGKGHGSVETPDMGISSLE